MKEFKLNSNSWHFKLATFGEGQGDKQILASYGTDICDYIRMVFKGLLKFIAVYGLVAGLVAWFVKSVYDIVMLFFGGEYTPFAFCFTVVLGTLLIIFAFEGTKWLFRKVKENAENTEVKPTFVGLAYRKFKDKTCFKIKFK